MSQPPHRNGGSSRSTLQAAGAAAISVIDGLKTNPAALAIVLLNIIFIISMAWVVNNQNNRRSELLTIILTKCLEQRHAN